MVQTNGYRLPDGEDNSDDGVEKDYDEENEREGDDDGDERGQNEPQNVNDEDGDEDEDENEPMMTRLNSRVVGVGKATAMGAKASATASPGLTGKSLSLQSLSDQEEPGAGEIEIGMGQAGAVGGCRLVPIGNGWKPGAGLAAGLAGLTGLIGLIGLIGWTGWETLN